MLFTQHNTFHRTQLKVKAAACPLLTAKFRVCYRVTSGQVFLRAPRFSNVTLILELVRNLLAHGDARERKWRGNWRMEWVASTLTPSPNVVYPALLKLMRTPRVPAVDWTDAPTDLNGLVRFGERRNLVSARVPSRFKRTIHNCFTS